MELSPEEQLHRLRRATIPVDTLLRDALEQLDAAGTGVLLLADAENKLRAILTDGDIRRAILHGRSMTDPAFEVATREPVVGEVGMTPEEVLRLMDHNPKGILLNHLPVVDGQGRLRWLYLRRDFGLDQALGVSAVVMAGGYGTRLWPLTESVPKPMLPVGDLPLLEQIIRRFRQSGIHRVNIATHFQPEVIREHFGDGRNFDVQITYVDEDRPLGTAGALGLMERPTEPLLVMNGDILTQTDFRSLLAYHREHHAALTVAVRQYDIKVPYGVMEYDGVLVKALREKPTYSFFVNAGVYLLEPDVYEYIPIGERYDMTDLIQNLIDGAQRVVSFPIVEYWRDIGQQIDYKQAQEDIRSGRVTI